MAQRAETAVFPEQDAKQTYVIQRTQAMPKNSLFGTSLENVDRELLHDIDSSAYETNRLREQQMKATQYEDKLPSRLQNKDAKSQLKAVEDDITKKKIIYSERQAAMVDMENRAKYYTSTATPIHQSEMLKKKMLLASPVLDFELTRKMNDVGYAEKNSYNKDKHRKRPPVHRYAVIGDPFEPGMDFSLHQTETHEKYSGHTPMSDHTRFYRSLRQHRFAPIVAESGGIPANIRAMYGSNLVRELFSDEKAVDKVKQQLSTERARFLRKHEKVELPAVEVTTPQNYGDLSHALRQDKFAGYTFFKPSLMKESHTQEVFDRRYKDPDEFRHRWDEYGKWKEKELCREKMDRDYEEFLESLPRLSANWDRNAQRKPKEPLPKPKPPKPKPRKRPLPSKANDTKPVFEDVTFISPPKTPQEEPPAQEIVPEAEFKRDDDFWNFYDQGLPPLR